MAPISQPGLTKNILSAGATRADLGCAGPGRARPGPLSVARGGMAGTFRGSSLTFHTGKNHQGCWRQPGLDVFIQGMDGVSPMQALP